MEGYDSNLKLWLCSLILSSKNISSRSKPTAIERIIKVWSSWHVYGQILSSTTFAYRYGWRTTYLEKVQHSWLEHWQITCFRPPILPRRVPVPTNLHGLFEIGSLRSKWGYFDCISGLGYSFTAKFDISTICTRVLPCKFVLPPDIRPRYTMLIRNIYLVFCRQAEEFRALSLGLET